jgi:hypothetical protein
MAGWFNPAIFINVLIGSSDKVYFDFPGGESQSWAKSKSGRNVMAKQLSFTKHEHEVLPDLRQKLNKAESTEDVKKFFIYTALELLEKIFEGEMRFDYEDIALTPGSISHYTVSQRLLSSEVFTSVWNHSDLPHLMGRLAESAVNRYRHLEKHPEKTDAKIRI